jgi:hypothetical protein
LTSSLAASTSSGAEVDGTLEVGGRLEEDVEGPSNEVPPREVSEFEFADEFAGMVRHMVFTRDKKT